MMTTMTSVTAQRLRVQGFNVDEAWLAEVAPWLRMTPALCATFTAVGTVLASPAIFFALATTAFLGTVLPFHPFDLIYNFGLRFVVGKRPLPPNRAPRRFACGIATVWLVTTGLLFLNGATGAAYALGAMVHFGRGPREHDRCLHSFHDLSSRARPLARIIARALSIVHKGNAELAMIREFEASYRKVTAPVMQEIERSVCGCGYGGTSWTTRDHAETMARLLSLRPGKTLLEVGAGAGWPAVYMAKLTGCRVVLTDLPIEGLRIAHDRANRDGLAGRYTVVQADGAALPVKDAAFDAVSHSDVLCCLEDKVGVLRECRRAIRKDGRMAFTVIYIHSGLSAADHAVAVSAGPAFVEADATYEAMLAQTGWQVTSHVDLTNEFAQSMHRMAQTQEANAAALVELSGADAAQDRLARVRQQLPAIERRLLLRGLFVAKPV